MDCADCTPLPTVWRPSEALHPESKSMAIPRFWFWTHLEMYFSVSLVHVAFCHVVVGVSGPVVGVGEVGQLLHPEAFPHRAVGKRLAVYLHLERLFAQTAKTDKRHIKKISKITLHSSTCHVPVMAEYLTKGRTWQKGKHGRQNIPKWPRRVQVLTFCNSVSPVTKRSFCRNLVKVELFPGVTPLENLFGERARYFRRMTLGAYKKEIPLIHQHHQ